MIQYDNILPLFFSLQSFLINHQEFILIPFSDQLCDCLFYIYTVHYFYSKNSQCSTLAPCITLLIDLAIPSPMYWCIPASPSPPLRRPVTRASSLSTHSSLHSSFQSPKISWTPPALPAHLYHPHPTLPRPFSTSSIPPSFLRRNTLSTPDIIGLLSGTIQ